MSNPDRFLHAASHAARSPAGARRQRRPSTKRSIHPGVPPAGARADPGDLRHVLLAGEQTGGALAVIELVVRHAPPRHVHHREDEFIYVLDGALTVEIDGVSFPAPTGTAVYLPRGVAHGFAIEEGPARLLVAFTPAGFERLVLASGDPTGAIDLPPSSTDEGDQAAAAERWAALAPAYGFDIVGPPVGTRPRAGSRDGLNGG